MECELSSISHNKIDNYLLLKVENVVYKTYDDKHNFNWFDINHSLY